MPHAAADWLCLADYASQDRINSVRTAEQELKADRARGQAAQAKSPQEKPGPHDKPQEQQQPARARGSGEDLGPQGKVRGGGAEPGSWELELWGEPLEGVPEHASQAVQYLHDRRAPLRQSCTCELLLVHLGAEGSGLVYCHAQPLTAHVKASTMWFTCAAR